MRTHEAVDPEAAGYGRSTCSVSGPPPGETTVHLTPPTVRGAGSEVMITGSASSESERCIRGPDRPAER
jgi:hypothetical protein